MFTLSNFVKSGLVKAVGHMADYQIILNAAGWLEKGVLTENDLSEIQTAIEAQYIVTGSDAEEETGGVEEITQEDTNEQQ